MREPHSKPWVYELLNGWVLDVFKCCPFEPGGEDQPPLYWHATWREAMDAALDHVAEVHTPQFAGRRDGTSDADLEASWHFHNLQQWHNRQEQAS